MEFQISEQIRKKLISYSLIAILILFFLADFVGKIGDKSGSELSNITWILKPLAFIPILFFMLIFWKKIPQKALLAFMGIVISFLLGQFFMISENNFLTQVTLNAKTLIWYLFPILAIPLVFFQRNLNIPLIKRIFEGIFIVNSIFVIIGLITQYPLFSSYNTYRFGFNGLYRFSTHSSFLYMIYLFYFFSHLRNQFSKKYIFLFLLAVAVSVVAGSKIMFIYIFGLSVLLLPRPYNMLLFIAALLSLLILIIQFDWIVNHFLNVYFPVLGQVLYKDGLFTMLVSERDLLFQNHFIPYITEKWTWLNFFFGGGDFHLFRSQFEFVDLFWFFGWVGMTLYLAIWHQAIYGRIPFTIAWFLFWLLVALAGNFFSTITVTFSFLVMILLIHRENLSQSTHQSLAEKH